MTDTSPDVARALTNQSAAVRRRLPRLRLLHARVDRANDLSFAELVQLYALTLELKPDLVVEIGRGYGNATAAFTQAANDLEGPRVISIGFDSEEAWQTNTWPRLAGEVEQSWPDALDARQQDLLTCDVAEVVGEAKRVLLWWDSHEPEHAQFLLARAFPLLAERENVVVVHDVTDNRYQSTDPSYERPVTWLGHLVGPFEDFVVIVDFLSRNEIATTTPLESLARLRQEDAPAWRAVSSAVADTEAGAALREGALLAFSLPSDRPLVFPVWEPKLDTAAAHHPAIARLPRWRGEEPAGWEVDVLGVRTNELFIHGPDGGRSAARTASPPLPGFDEEYFEWIDLAEAVESAAGVFTMVELGAGYGRWIARGAALARERGLTANLVGVEADPTHVQWMKKHLAVNGVDGGSARLVEAAVFPRTGWVAFARFSSAESYGQAVDTVEPEFFERRPLGRKLRAGHGRDANVSRRVVRATTLHEILEPLERVDLIDVDIQGAEADVLEAAADVVDAKVALMHVGTHGREYEERLRTLFERIGWQSRYDFPSGTTQITEWGPIVFSDGVQSWRNPRLSPSSH